MGRQFRAINTFSANDSNTICDLTGFKVKMSEVKRRWEGFYVLSSAWHPRQPQDFPVIPQPQHVHKNVRIEQVEAEGAVDSFDIV
jgi:hypothetical protein